MRRSYTRTRTWCACRPHHRLPCAGNARHHRHRTHRQSRTQDRQVDGDRPLGPQPRTVRRRGADVRGARAEAHQRRSSTVCSTARRRSATRRWSRGASSGEPIPRIKGHYAFRGLDLLIRDDVFVPRASSELLAEEAIKALRRRRGPRVAVDVATGAGPVALAVANEVPHGRRLGCRHLDRRRRSSARTTRAVSASAMRISARATFSMRYRAGCAAPSMSSPSTHRTCSAAT